MKRLEGWVYLCGISQELEADIIVGVLKDNDITALKDYPEAGGFLKIAYGLTSGVDIYVPELQIKKARELLETFQGPDIYEEKEGREFQTGEMTGQEFEGKEEIPAPYSTTGKNTHWSKLIALMLVLLGIALLLANQRKGLF